MLAALDDGALDLDCCSDAAVEGLIWSLRTMAAAMR
jgi:hypothetical protein